VSDIAPAIPLVIQESYPDTERVLLTLAHNWRKIAKILDVCQALLGEKHQNEAPPGCPGGACAWVMFTRTAYMPKAYCRPIENMVPVRMPLYCARAVTASLIAIVT
jgi:hypothetical protein